MLAAPVVLLCDGLYVISSHTQVQSLQPGCTSRLLLNIEDDWCSWFAVAGFRRLGMVMPDAVESAAAANAAWLEDVIEHLLCVLALDRFADYVSDQVSIFSTTG